MRLFIIIFLFSMHYMAVYSQKDTSSYPAVGKPMPGFTLKNIAYFSKKEATAKDFRKKWLLLDFWNRSCGSCVASFPKINAIQKCFGDQVQVMLVGIQDPYNEIQKIYAKFRERENLVLPCAFDSSIAKRFDIYTTPYTILIDDKGIVQCISISLDTAAMRGFLTGHPPSLPKAYRLHEDDSDQYISFDYRKLFMIGGNGAKDTDFLFQSALSKWNGNIYQQHAASKISDPIFEHGSFKTSGTPLMWLFEYAYWGQICYPSWDSRDTSHYGKDYYQPRLEIRDPSKFNYSFNENINIYNYSLSMPRASSTPAAMQAAMQRDLESYFGYVANIEIRKCPYWKLIALPGTIEKLQTKGGARLWENSHQTGLTAKNCSFSSISDWIKVGTRDYVSDETHITGNVDITINCASLKFDSLRQALRVAGLDLVPAEKDMKVLVIRDKNFMPSKDSGNSATSDTSFLFRAVLSKWDQNIHHLYIIDKIQDYDIKRGYFQTLGVPLEWLFKYAYLGEVCSRTWHRRDTVHYGKYYCPLQLEINDSSKFKYSYDQSINMYSYSLFMSPCTLEDMEKAMQHGLETYFGYVAHLETRKCPYWRLVAMPGTIEKLRTKDAPYSVKTINHAGFTATNYPFSEVCDWIKASIHDYVSDETNITGNVDITLDCIPSNFDDLLLALRLAGMDLVPAEKDMKVLVIRDAKPAAPFGHGGDKVTNR